MSDDIRAGAKADPLGKIMLAIITALVLWMGKSVQENSELLARQEERFISFQSQIRDAREDRYTATQAHADQALLKQQVERALEWAGNLSIRIRTLEAANRVER